MTARAELYRRLPVLDGDRWWLDLAAAAPGGRILELGAGTGRLSAALAADGRAVTAVEPDPEMLRVLRSRGDVADAPVEVLAADAAALPEVGQFGLVILATSLLNELPDAAARTAVLAEAARCCRPDGAVAVHLLGPWWLARLSGSARGTLHPADGSAPIEVVIEAGELEAFRSRRRAHLRYRFPDAEVHTEDLDAAIVTPEELSAVLERSGLEPFAHFGAAPPAPLTADDPAWHLLARPV